MRYLRRDAQNYSSEARATLMHDGTRRRSVEQVSAARRPLRIHFDLQYVRVHPLAVTCLRIWWLSLFSVVWCMMRAERAV